jgi:hypothetical protein
MHTFAQLRTTLMLAFWEPKMKIGALPISMIVVTR